MTSHTFSVGDSVRNTITGEVGTIVNVYSPRKATFTRYQVKYSDRQSRQTFHVDFPEAHADAWERTRP